jgi:hypothetical protein
MKSWKDTTHKFVFSMKKETKQRISIRLSTKEPAKLLDEIDSLVLSLEKIVGQAQNARKRETLPLSSFTDLDDVLGEVANANSQNSILLD